MARRVQNQAGDRTGLGGVVPDVYQLDYVSADSLPRKVRIKVLGINAKLNTMASYKLDSTLYGDGGVKDCTECHHGILLKCRKKQTEEQAACPKSSHEHKCDGCGRKRFIGYIEETD